MSVRPVSFFPEAGALARGLDDLGAVALVVVATGSGDPDLAGAVGPVRLGECLWVAPRSGRPALFFLSPMEREEAAATGLDLVAPADIGFDTFLQENPSAELRLATTLERVLARLGIVSGRLALAGSYPVGTVWEAGKRLERAGYTLTSGNRLSRLLRKRKGERELGEARRVAAGAATAMRRVAELLAAAIEREGELFLAGERLRVGRLKQAVARSFADFELEQPEGNLIAPAEEGAVPHNTGNPERVLRAGESLIVDLFPKGWLFADITRTFCWGAPPEPLARAHDAVLAALDRAYPRLLPAALAENSRAFSVQDAVCSHFDRLGYPNPNTHPNTTTGYVHNLGHGVGFELHEFPSFRREEAEEGRLEVGDLLTFEPGLYDPEAGWAVRLEDLVYLGPEGPENLTSLPYALDPREWS